MKQRFKVWVFEAIGLIQHELWDLRREINKLKALIRPVRRFIIRQDTESIKGEVMAQGTLKGIAPGGIGAFAVTPVDSNGNPSALPSGIVPAWTSSDPTNAPVVASSDGLSATVQTTAAYTGCTLTVTATLADGTTPTGTAPVPVLSLEVASFVLTQTS